ncbi:hypothetical protein BGL34_00700 [Fructilactobacillus lindneri]|uniref:Uncharacterized protein n=2 Tax=Fructilactobacillus lindneri TaxID=53444 RepID=A0A0R2JX09_9LACO|nr:hypothetical protein [Fructilactobacillus lindneri]ANZ58302.1 hypothetical protein AYR60_05880 [Fructilactobacillus lindneri]ANZ59624.1 hypothetical protein AYR59_06135 [Fructilactobacillus lindneri]KRN79130.1 hypothetical protein IV52_GL000536 [Fructilactobacillus lindneri DSM 20690 = JCM 11027]POG98592.1 hypothetical protein BGL31_01290 [Fructilactobacillus lindneri]POH03980.1 hypothetical protein BGL32_01230 [Fructilactobacillus lindneri]
MIDFIKTLVSILPLLTIIISIFNIYIKYRNSESNKVSLNNPVRFINIIIHKNNVSFTLGGIITETIGFSILILGCIGIGLYVVNLNLFWVSIISICLTLVVMLLSFEMTSISEQILGPKTKYLPLIKFNKIEYCIIGEDGNYLFLIELNSEYKPNNKKDKNKLNTKQIPKTNIKQVLKTLIKGFPETDNNQFSKTNIIFLIPNKKIKNNIPFREIENSYNLKPFVKNFKNGNLTLKFLKDNNQSLKNKKRKYKLFGYNISIKKSKKSK